MSEASKSLAGSTGHGKIGPDYFGFYTREIIELLSEEEDFPPFTIQTSELTRRKCDEVRDKDTTDSRGSGAGSFSNSIGAGLSDFKKERLKSLLRQCVFDLTPEVDEMLDPVIAMSQLQSQIRNRKSLSSDIGAESKGLAGEVPCKKLKTSSSFSSTSIPAHASPLNSGSCREGSVSNRIDSKTLDVALIEKEIFNDKKNCAPTKKTSESLCNACTSSYRQEKNFQLGSNTKADKENGEVDDDLQFLLENDSLQVEETIKKYSDELSGTLGHMERQLEELLNAVVSKCRPMTLTEKQELWKLIQKLPPNNLDRVVEIVQHNKLTETRSYDEFFIDLEKEDNVTLWRLCYYVKAVEKARELLS